MDLYQELSLQDRDLRFQQVMSITTKNNRFIRTMEYLKAVITPECLLILDGGNKLRAMAVPGTPFTVVRRGSTCYIPFTF